MKRTLRGLVLSALTVVLGMTLLSPNANALVPAYSMVYNGGDIGIGAIHVWDGDYTYPGKYDKAISPNHRTDEWWAAAEGVFIGAGYCVNVYSRPDVLPGDNTSGWVKVTTWAAANGNRQFKLATNKSYWMSANPGNTC